MQRENSFILTVAILGVAAVVLFVAGPPQRQEVTPAARGGEAARTVTVTGSGRAEGRQDAARVVIDVEGAGDSGSAARADAAARVDALAAKLRDFGVARDGIRPVRLQVLPTVPETSYRAAQRVEVALSDTDRLGPALDAITSVAGTSVPEVAFGYKDIDALREQALQLALRDARDKAEAAAAASRSKVSGLRSLVVQPPAPPAGAAPVEVTVQAVFELR